MHIERQVTKRDLEQEIDRTPDFKKINGENFLCKKSNWIWQFDLESWYCLNKKITLLSFFQEPDEIKKKIKSNFLWHFPLKEDISRIFKVKTL